MNAKVKLNAKIANLTTQQLIDISLMLALDTSNEAIIVCAKVEGELARRLPENEFVTHCSELEALMDAAS